MMDKVFCYNGVFYRKITIPYDEDDSRCDNCVFATGSINCERLQRLGIIDDCTETDTPDKTTIYKRLEDSTALPLNIL